jgi:hypothetical protein
MRLTVVTVSRALLVAAPLVFTNVRYRINVEVVLVVVTLVALVAVVAMVAEPADVADVAFPRKPPVPAVILPVVDILVAASAPVLGMKLIVETVLRAFVVAAAETTPTRKCCNVEAEVAVVTLVAVVANVALLAVPVNVPLTVKLGTTSVLVPGL